MSELLGFVGGFVLLVIGGEALVRGASGLALRLGVSEVVVGLTVVAFGTSAPELAVSSIAAIQGSSGVAFGNVAGSNVANLGLLLGLTALMRPIEVHGTIVTREIPMLMLCSAAALVLGWDGLFGTGPSVYSRGDGVMLLLLFGVFLYYTSADVGRQRRRPDPLLEAAEEVAEAVEESVDELPGPALWGALGLVLAGIVGLVLGGHLLVGAAVSTALGLGVPEVVVSATIVAVGTSLPELVTCIVASRKGMQDLVVGNVVGSNVFNILLVLGSTAVLRPIPLPAGGGVDLAAFTLLALGLLPLALTHGRRIVRWEGALLVGTYAVYLVYQALR